MRLARPTSSETDETVAPEAKSRIRFARTTLLCATLCERDKRSSSLRSSLLRTIRMDVFLATSLRIRSELIDRHNPMAQVINLIQLFDLITDLRGAVLSG
jgi:hypothetical protein